MLGITTPIVKMAQEIKSALRDAMELPEFADIRFYRYVADDNRDDAEMNDLIFGFCNDQYCFSQLQKYVASKIGATVGDYYHFAQDLHIYLPSTNVYPKHINDYLKNNLKL